MKQAKKSKNHNLTKLYEKKQKNNIFWIEIFCVIIAVATYLGICFVAVFVLSGCVKYIDKEVLVPYEVKVPVPTKCKYSMPKEIIPNTQDLQGLFNSLTELIERDRQIRNSLRKIPCLIIE